MYGIWSMGFHEFDSWRCGQFMVIYTGCKQKWKILSSALWFGFLVMVMAIVKTQGTAEWLKSSHCGRLSYTCSLS